MIPSFKKDSFRYRISQWAFKMGFDLQTFHSTMCEGRYTYAAILQFKYKAHTK